jgi:hypothetical protein
MGILMENLISKTEAIQLFKTSKSWFEDYVKKHNIPKIKKFNSTYYERDTIIQIASELEHRRQIRVTTWKSGQT